MYMQIEKIYRYICILKKQQKTKKSKSKFLEYTIQDSPFKNKSPLPSDPVLKKQLKEKQNQIAIGEIKIKNQKLITMNFVKQISQLDQKYEGEHARFTKNNDYPLIGERCQVLGLLGKEGFSEVYKADDLQKLREVACKIHQLNSNWSDQIMQIKIILDTQLEKTEFTKIKSSSHSKIK